MTQLAEIVRQLGAVATGPWEASAGHQLAAVQDIVTHDSRRVLPGGLFVAIRGATVDGHRFIGEAVQRGALAIVSEEAPPTGYTGLWLRVSDARQALARIATIVHGAPSTRLSLVGVTGTNGKTTTAHLVASIFAAAGKRTAVMGTIGYQIAGQAEAAPFTPPEAPEIADFLRRAVESGVTHAVMEVSSIALALHRADDLHFQVAAFTNLTQDHLDFHGTMEEYFDAKCRLFDGRIGVRPGHVVVNLDDPYGRRLLSRLESEGTRCSSFGIIPHGEISAAGERGGPTPVATVRAALPAAPSWWLSLGYLALAGTVVAFAAFLTLQHRMGPGPASTVGVMTPLVALGVSAAFEGYRPGLATLAGMTPPHTPSPSTPSACRPSSNIGTVTSLPYITR